MIDSLSRSNFTPLEQNEWLRVTLASIGEAVITTDNAGNVTFLNPVAQTLTGWSQEEAVGKPLDTVFQIVNESTRLPVENPAIRALREGIAVGLANHTLLLAKGGKECPIDDSAAPIKNAKGAVAGVVLVFRDVSERKKQEHLVQDALAYADNIIATIREPFLVLDQKLRVVTANGSFYRNFHVTPEETTGKYLYDLGNRQWDIPSLRTLLEEVLPQNHVFQDFEVEHDFPVLGRKSMLLNARRIRKPGNHSELILLAIENVTERKKAENAVHVSEVRYRRLFESAKDGILILDMQSGHITDANPYMSDLLGYPHDHFLGKELWEIGLFEDKLANENAVSELREQGYIRYEHLPLETIRGRRVEVEVVANAYREGRNSVIQYNIRDITDRSRLEKRLQQQALALADLHRRKDEFLAMLSHELRNPLAPIANATYLLRLRNGDDPLRAQALTIIERQVGQLTRLVDDLMEVSRISTGRVQLRQDRVMVNGIVERAVETSRPQIDQRKHHFEISLPPQPIWLFADAARLEQVFVNLLTNASKYTDEGGRIGLTVRHEGDECVVRLRDNGVGIAPELLPRIFDLFTQAERSLDRSQGGLGIGLALVQRLVEMHRGTVEVNSTLGKGSEFIVRLPVVLSQAPQPLPVPAAVIEPLPRSLKVLVVDDNVDSSESLALLLQTSGHEVRTAHDGPTALVVALEFRPNAVLLDIGLPKMDGYEVAKTLRQQAIFKGTTLVAITGYGQEKDRKRSLDAGFDHHLVKPAEIDMVRQILATISSEIV